MPRLTFKSLMSEFIPISMSDMVMTLGDPLIALALASRPDGIIYLAAFGIAKGIAVFFESPIIMILHASNAMNKEDTASRSLRKVAMMLGLALTSMMALSAEFIYGFSHHLTFGDLSQQSIKASAQIVFLLTPWPFLISVRRYYQGRLISEGHSQRVAIGSFIRIFLLTCTLWLLSRLDSSGSTIAGLSMLIALIAELTYILIYSKKYLQNPKNHTHLCPQSLSSIWSYYIPLIWTMISIWGSRLGLTLVLALSGEVVMAIWSAGWALVISLANGVRMIQQLMIRHDQPEHQRSLKIFTLTIGTFFSCLFLMISLTPLGQDLIILYTSGKQGLANAISQMILIFTPLPFLMAIQNAAHGIAIREGKTKLLGKVTFGSSCLLLTMVAIGKIFGAISIEWVSGSIISITAVEIIFLRFTQRDDLQAFNQNILEV